MSAPLNPAQFGFSPLDPDEVNAEETFHGTSRDQEDRIARGVRTNLGGNLGRQQGGPGFYVTPDWELAAHYARNRVQPSIVVGQALSENPVRGTVEGLRGLGSAFREHAGKALEGFRDVDLGNIALRHAGHDYLRLVRDDTEEVQDVVLRPKRWDATEFGEP